MTIVVTGASGDLGRRVTTELLAPVPADELVLVSRTPDALAPGVEARFGDFDPGHERVRRARHEHEVVGGHASEQLRRDATAEVPGGTRDDDRHDSGSGQNPSFRWAICSPRRW